MSSRVETALKLVCACLALLLLVQLGFSLSNGGRPPGELASAPGKGETLARAASRPGPAEVPAPVRARVEAIKNSELFGPVPRPLPMALLGIAGHDALIRTPTGQTGLLRESEELGGVKLLRIGTNRVLVEHEGKKSELTLFAGLGGEPLLPQEGTK